MRVVHSIWAWLLSVSIAAALATMSTSAAEPITGQVANFSIRAGGVLVGAEQVAVERTAQGTTISSTGRLGPPFDIVLRALEIRYDPNGKPLSMSVSASLRERGATLQTTVNGANASTTLTPQDGQAVTNTGAIDSAAVLLPSPFVAPYEALAMRLRTAVQGSVIAVYQSGDAAPTVEVGNSTVRQIQTLDKIIRARQTSITLAEAGAPPIAIDVWGDENGRLLRVVIPSQQIEFIREDIASVSARIVTMSRPNDEDVRIPANGFSLTGTLSKPSAASRQLPAVLLVSGADRTDRDETIAGVPIFGQLADALADDGTIVLRYDKRGIGQSGGRSDVATLADFADDAKAAVQFLRGRKDVDRRRIVVVGHGEGGWIAMLTAAGNSHVAAVGLLSTGAVTGADLNLYQVSHGLERAARPDPDRQHTIDLQKQIQQAVISGQGWEAINVTPQVRRQAETPYFQSFLTLDPAKLVRRIDQPILVLQGALDKEVPPGNAEQLAAMAKERKKDKVVALVQVPGVNHLLLPATTGEIDEYGALPDRQVSQAVLSAVTEWVKKLP